MLLDWAKTKDDDEEAKAIWERMRVIGIRNGHKGVNPDNFIDLRMDHCRYKVNGTTYHGYFTMNEINDIFKVIDYHEGEIITIN